MIATVEQWDERFACCGDEQARKEWLAARSVHTDPAMLDRWATIIEMNRIDRATKKAPVSDGPTEAWEGG